MEVCSEEVVCLLPSTAAETCIGSLFQIHEVCGCKYHVKIGVFVEGACVLKGGRKRVGAARGR